MVTNKLLVNLAIFFSLFTAVICMVALFGVIPLRNAGSTIVFLIGFISSLLLAGVYIGEKTNEKMTHNSDKLYGHNGVKDVL